MYDSSYRPCVALAQVWITSRIFVLTSSLTAATPYAFNNETRLSINSREAISVRKCDPPFFTQVSVSFKAEICTLGFLLPIRLFNDRMASLGCTVLDRMRSEISRLVAMSSKLEEVAFSICSSKAEVPEVNHPAMALVVPQTGVEMGKTGEEGSEPQFSSV